MAMQLTCRMERHPDHTRIIIPVEETPRAYMLLDAMLLGELKGFELVGKGGTLHCHTAEADGLTPEAWMVAPRSVEYVKSVLFQVTMQSSAAAWLHADIETPTGDVTISFSN